MVCLIGISACKHNDDLYINPNNPLHATPQTLLTEIEVATMNTYEGDLTRTAGILVQHGVGADGQATATQVYSLQESLFDNQWGQLYQTLGTADSLRTIFGKANPYYEGIADIMMAMNWGALTDLWGDVPYVQALKIKLYPSPMFDAQQVVYAGINTLLDSAISKLSVDPSMNVFQPSTDDLIFGGSTANWIKTAWTLKARYLNRYSNKSNYDKATILTWLANGITDAGSDCMAVHGLKSNESNQWYAYLNSRAYIVAASTLVDTMATRPTDLRLDFYFDSTGGGVGGSSVDSPTLNASYWGPYLAGSSATPTPLVTYAEAKFIEAEVKVRQADPTAFTTLNDAIVASCTKVTGGLYTGADIATYTATNTNLNSVMFEKWIAMFGQMEVYTDYRRTKLPHLTPVAGASTTTIPDRFPMSQAERTGNKNTPSPAASSIILPVWFETP